MLSLILGNPHIKSARVWATRNLQGFLKMHMNISSRTAIQVKKKALPSCNGVSFLVFSREQGNVLYRDYTGGLFPNTQLRTSKNRVLEFQGSLFAPETFQRSV